MAQRERYCPRDATGEIDMTGVQSGTLQKEAKTP